MIRLVIKQTGIYMKWNVNNLILLAVAFIMT